MRADESMIPTTEMVFPSIKGGMRVTVDTTRGVALLETTNIEARADITGQEALRDEILQGGIPRGTMTIKGGNIQVL